MDNALSGLTVIEIPGGVATRYCGHLFAAHGATVVKGPYVAETLAVSVENDYVVVDL